MPKGIKGFVKGKSGNPAGKPVGIKNADTLTKEARRVIFENEVSQIWIETIKKLRPEYIADQFIGKASDKLEVEVNLKLNV